MAKKKTTKQVRAIDRIIKFQIDDGIESLTIGGKTDLADLEIDSKQNVTLHLNADADKLNEVKSLVPFITIKQKTTDKDPDKKKTAELIHDLRGFALELAEDSKQLAEIIKEESSITLDLSQLISRLNKMVDDIDTAQRTADRAEGKADTAQETADRAEGKADTAQATADRAEGKANNSLIDVLDYDTSVIPLESSYFLESEIPNNLVSVVDKKVFAGNLFQYLTDLRMFLIDNFKDTEYFEHEDSNGFVTRYEVIKYNKYFGFSPYGERQKITMVRVKNHNNKNIDVNLWTETNKGTIIGSIFGVSNGLDYSDNLPEMVVVGAKLYGNIANGHLLASINQATAPDLMIYIVTSEVPI